MTVFRSNKQIYVQLVDDVTGNTLVSASSKEKEIASQKVNKIEQAKLVGKRIAEKAKEKGIESVVFDRSGYLYHGRVKNLADAAREGGLKI
jgi:large subunit ribosomal protein L18